MMGSIPYLSSPASGSPLGVALHARTMRRSYPGTDKRAQVPPISQRWSTKWWYGSIETERPTHPVCMASHRFENRGHDHLDPRDIRCVASHRHGIMVMIASGPVTFAAQ
jgi:hypothetical protein